MEYLITERKMNTNITGIRSEKKMKQKIKENKKTTKIVSKSGFVIFLSEKSWRTVDLINWLPVDVIDNKTMYKNQRKKIL